MQFKLGKCGCSASAYVDYYSVCVCQRTTLTLLPAAPPRVAAARRDLVAHVAISSSPVLAYLPPSSSVLDTHGEAHILHPPAATLKFTPPQEFTFKNTTK